MTDKLHCPFCGAELEEFGGSDFPLLHYCDNTNCNLYHIMGQYTLWQALIQAKQDLEIAKYYVKGISEMVINSGDNIYIVIGHFKKLAEQTLEQIEQKEQQ